MRKPKPGTSLADLAPPHLLDDWDSGSNPLPPSAYPAGSLEKAHWVCASCGHRWRAAVRNRVKGSGCPLCARLGTPGERLDQLHPQLAAEWDLGANGIPLSMLPASSGTRAHWRCPQGHSYAMGVAHRVRGGSCPICAGREALGGSSDLASTHPHLVTEWDHADNGDLDPTQVTASSSQSAHWLCATCGHGWVAPISQRTQRGTGCPFCAGKVTIPGTNDLATLHPGLMAEWDRAANGDLDPRTLSPGSRTRAHWVCVQGHSWEATVTQRVRGSHCPTCAQERSTVAPRSRSLAAVHPDLWALWDGSRNGDLDPWAIYPNSTVEAHWVCALGHTWETTPRALVKFHSAPCPVCDNRRVLVGFNDLATLRPDLAAQWHPTLNGTSAAGVTSGSDLRAWWRCDRGHTWAARVGSRAYYDSDCPDCVARDTISRGESELGDFLRGLLGDGKVLSQDHGTIGPLELDLLVPSRGLAVEFNGIHWHSEARGKSRDYHWDKWDLCRRRGIQLVQVWEDDWLERRPIVESMLRHKLGLGNGPRVGARSTVLREVGHGAVAGFLDTHHIQGSVPGSLYLALDHGGAMVAASVWTRRGKDLVLERYATSATVAGGLGKMLHRARDWALSQGLERIVTFSAHDVSDGGLYATLGFLDDGEIPPDYSYVVGRRRVHKFNYRRARFRDDPGLLWDPTLSETGLAALNGLNRIWDSGKTRWVLPLRS